MLHLWGRLSSINVRKVVLCAQVLGIELPRSDAGMAHGMVNTPAYLADIPTACEVHRWWGLPQARPAWPRRARPSPVLTP